MLNDPALPRRDPQVRQRRLHDHFTVAVLSNSSVSATWLAESTSAVVLTVPANG